MLVTIGIPFYNSEKTLLNSIRSVFAQTYKEWELILIDDGSSDSSLEIAKSIKDKRIKVISDGLNRGLPYRLNEITKIAKGSYIARMDADDLMHPDRIMKQINYLKRNKEIDLVGTSTYIINEKSEVTGKRATSELDLKPKSILEKGLYIHPTVLGKASWFIKNSYSEDYPRAEDHEIWIRTLNKSTFSKLNEPLFFYRENNKININNYTLSCKTDRKIIKTYGREIIGDYCSRKLIFKSFCKEKIYQFCVKLNMENQLVKKRNFNLISEEKNLASQTLLSIINTPLPGIDI
ncbi:glycosyltransferase family 2 protein [Paenisporosarcina sp. NPDC076898]|uniref:glycosyltransferase family 2 protein n=1 Tax=unclassified Paenisporosarcina TaxID=2642018 RepID=UPI003D068B69